MNSQVFLNSHESIYGCVRASKCDSAVWDSPKSTKVACCKAELEIVSPDDAGRLATLSEDLSRSQRQNSFQRSGALSVNLALHGGRFLNAVGLQNVAQINGPQRFESI